MNTQTKKLIATFFYLGYLPLVPGTFGSIAGLFIYIFSKNNPYFLIFINCTIMVTGFLLAGKTATIFNRHDPAQIVIDEVNGMLISFLGLSIENKLILFTGFIVFRILDSIKLYPANLFHRKTGSVAIMGDDIVAGIYTNLILRLIFIIVK